MPYREKTVSVTLPELEADEMTARATMEGIEPGRYIGYQALKSFRGLIHPVTVAFLARAFEGQVGTDSDEQSS